MGISSKGTVTPLSSVFSAEDAQKASKRVLDKIAERQEELDQLQNFISDNNSLVNLVQKLPEELLHDIMVPFGKAAFFPGRLVHTNEFLVFLGEGYYADRTYKQTTEILKRRGKVLESQIESLKAVMQDLQAEASFFDTTAAEAAEGIVEIREDYIEEASSEDVSIPGVQKNNSHSLSESNNKRAVVEDEEYARLLSRIEELEKEELEAENVNEYVKDELDEADLGIHTSQLSPDCVKESSEMPPLSNFLEQPMDKFSTEKSVDNPFHQEVPDQFASNSKIQLEDSKVQSASKDGSSRGKHTAFSKFDINELELKDYCQVQPKVKNEGSVLISESHNSSKAFTGSIVEHSHNVGRNPREQTTASSSKPVSRFKTQRR